MDFAEQSFIVTGGSHGVGQAVVKGLAKAGAQVVFSYAAHAPDETLACCVDLSGTVVALHVDLREPSGAAALVKAALEQGGRLDGLVNCAESSSYVPVEDLDTQQWRTVLATSLTSVYHTCRTVLRPMMQRRYGRIVNVAGLHGVGGFPGQADYSAAMGGIFGLTRALAREVALWQITVNAVASGLVQTDSLSMMPSTLLAWCEQLIAMRRIGSPEEVAAAALFFASPQATYITGQTLAVDGGWQMT